MPRPHRSSRPWPGIFRWTKATAPPSSKRPAEGAGAPPGDAGGAVAVAGPSLTRQGTPQPPPSSRARIVSTTSLESATSPVEANPFPVASTADRPMGHPSTHHPISRSRPRGPPFTTTPTPFRSGVAPTTVTSDHLHSRRCSESASPAVGAVSSEARHESTTCSRSPRTEPVSGMSTRETIVRAAKSSMSVDPPSRPRSRAQRIALTEIPCE